MRHYNSVFHSVLKHVPWAQFDRLVEKHDADHRVRRLPTKSQFIALLYGQLSGAVSLREIVAGLTSHAARLYHVGGREVARSTLADANRERPCALFGELFAAIAARAHGGLRRSVAEATYLIDATSLPLNGLSGDWARFSASACNAKLHVIYDPDADQPIYAGVTPGRVNDITEARDMPIEPGATYVFDLGYYDYAWWAKLDGAGCRIVTRLKSNTPLTVTAEMNTPVESDILSDRIGLLPRRQARSRKNPFNDPVREIRVRTTNGSILRVLTNDLDATAREIADLYKRRWAIELFFRWVKQTLKIRHFLGVSQNAVRIQIAIALIAFLLLRIAQKTQNAIQSPLEFTRLVRVNLLHRRALNHLRNTEPIRNENPNQLQLAWS